MTLTRTQLISNSNSINRSIVYSTTNTTTSTIGDNQQVVLVDNDNNSYEVSTLFLIMSTHQSATTILSAGKLLREFCPPPYAATYQSMNKIQEHNRHQQSTMQTSYILDSIR